MFSEKGAWKMDKEESIATTVLGITMSIAIAIYATLPQTETYQKEIEIPQGGTLYGAIANAASDKDNLSDVLDKTMRDYGLTDTTVQPGQKFIITLRK